MGNNEIDISKKYSYVDYEKWEDRWELIDGTPYVKSPEPVYGHQRIATRLSGEFYFQLKNSPIYTVCQPLNYKIADDTVLQPDMLIICGDVGYNQLYLNFPPLLVAEVLSPSTALRDRNTKFKIYQTQGVRYYLILSPDNKEVEIYELENSRYVLKAKGNEIQYEFDLPGCNATIDFRQVW
ncbi:MAG TPA: Uma2 family endonuclease [Puia sp.]|nr:Uma2 family endonuclease [Puia sp.]